MIKKLFTLLILLVCIFWCTTPASATVQIKLIDLSYRPCPPELSDNMVLFGGVMAAKCYLVEGTTRNSSGKTVYNADVFGRVYDAYGNDAVPERGRLGSLDLIPPGDNPFQLMISVPAEQLEPLELKQFKASGFTGHVRR